jgi:hypothetical protein
MRHASISAFIISAIIASFTISSVKNAINREMIAYVAIIHITYVITNPFINTVRWTTTYFARSVFQGREPISARSTCSVNTILAEMTLCARVALIFIAEWCVTLAITVRHTKLAMRFTAGPIFHGGEPISTRSAGAINSVVTKVTFFTNIAMMFVTKWCVSTAIAMRHAKLSTFMRFTAGAIFLGRKAISARSAGAINSVVTEVTFLTRITMTRVTKWCVPTAIVMGHTNHRHRYVSAYLNSDIAPATTCSIKGSLSLFPSVPMTA